MRFGDVNVSNALAPERRSTFLRMRLRDAGGAGEAERDAGLAEKLGVRLDMPGSLLRELIGKVADVVRARRILTAQRPVEGGRTQGSAAAAGSSGAARKAIDYTQAQSEVVTLNRTGKLNNSIVNRFAVRGEYVHVVAALALKADVKVEAIEPLLEPDRVYGLIVACKAARLTWSTTTMIVRNRPGCPPSTDRELEQCVAVFKSLLLSVAQWTIDSVPMRFLQRRTNRQRLRRLPMAN